MMTKSLAHARLMMVALGGLLPSVLLRASTPMSPTSEPAITADLPVPTPALPEEFAILKTRDVFRVAGSQAAGPAAGGPEAGFVLKGVIQAGEGFTAFIEDLGSKQVREITLGQPLARGKIKSIDLTGVEYVSEGSLRRIEVGQDLNGSAPVPAAPASASPGNTPAPPQQKHARMARQAAFQMGPGPDGSEASAVPAGNATAGDEPAAAPSGGGTPTAGPPGQ